MDEKTRRKIFRKRLGILLFVLLNVAVIGITAYMDFGQEGHHTAPEELHPLMLLAVLGCFITALGAETLKYYILIGHSTGKKSLKQAFRVAALGKYYDNITPLGAGGQPFQALYLNRNGVEAGTATAIPVAGFITGQLAFILLAILVFVFGGFILKMVTVKLAAVVGFVFYIFLPAALLFFIVLPKGAEKVLHGSILLLGKLRLIKDCAKAEEKARHTMLSAKDSIFSMYHGRHIFVWSMLLSIVFQIAIVSMPYFVLHAFGNDMPFLQVGCATVFIYLCITFVPTPGNSGMAEVSFYALFSVLGQANLFWAMLVWRFFCYYLFIGVGLGVTLDGALERRRAARKGTELKPLASGEKEPPGAGLQKD